MSVASRMVLAVIGFYRYVISPMLPAHCRYRPTCSAYAVEAVRRFGALSGGGLALRRLLRCHPWGGWGDDPVPPAPPGGPRPPSERPAPTDGSAPSLPPIR